jgi:hypothetical protein
MLQYVKIISEKYDETGCILSFPFIFFSLMVHLFSSFLIIVLVIFNEEYCEGQYRVSMIPGDYHTLLGELNKITKGDFNFELDASELAVHNFSPIPSIPHSLNPSIPQSLNPSFPHSLIPSFPHSFIPSFPQSLNPSIPQSLILILY